MIISTIIIDIDNGVILVWSSSPQWKLIKPQCKFGVNTILFWEQWNGGGRVWCTEKPSSPSYDASSKLLITEK